MQNRGIHKIYLIISENVSNVKKVEIALDNEEKIGRVEEIEKLKEEISILYEISKDSIFIKLK